MRAFGCYDRPWRIRFNFKQGETMNKKPRLLYLIVVIFFIAGLSACAAKRPVLYPNDYFNSVGEETSKADIGQCMEMAEASGVENEPGKEVAKDTAKGGVIGGVTGAAVGAVFGNAGQGAAAGAAGGAAGGLAGSAMNSGEPDPVYRGFVEQCLREKGYQPIGWK